MQYLQMYCDVTFPRHHNKAVDSLAVKVHVAHRTPEGRRKRHVE